MDGDGDVLDRGERAGRQVGQEGLLGEGDRCVSVAQLAPQQIVLRPLQGLVGRRGRLDGDGRTLAVAGDQPHAVVAGAGGQAGQQLQAVPLTPVTRRKSSTAHPIPPTSSSTLRTSRSPEPKIARNS